MLQHCRKFVSIQYFSLHDRPFFHPFPSTRLNDLSMATLHFFWGGRGNFNNKHPPCVTQVVKLNVVIWHKAKISWLNRGTNVKSNKCCQWVFSRPINSFTIPYPYLCAHSLLSLGSKSKEGLFMHVRAFAVPFTPGHYLDSSRHDKLRWERTTTLANATGSRLYLSFKVEEEPLGTRSSSFYFVRVESIQNLLSGLVN